MIVGQPKPVPYLVTIVKAESGIRTGSQGVTLVNSSADVSDLNKVLEEHVRIASNIAIRVF